MLRIATLTTPHIMHVSLHMIEIFHENMAANQFEVEAMVRGYDKYMKIFGKQHSEKTLSVKEKTETFMIFTP